MQLFWWTAKGWGGLVCWTSDTPVFPEHWEVFVPRGHGADAGVSKPAAVWDSSKCKCWVLPVAFKRDSPAEGDAGLKAFSVPFSVLSFYLWKPCTTNLWLGGVSLLFLLQTFTTVCQTVGRFCEGYFCIWVVLWSSSSHLFMYVLPLVMVSP